jgi:hypothetical protein
VLDQYLEAGHLVLDGFLASAPVSVVVPPYAQTRMRQRDIDEAELIAALASCRSSHGKGQTEGRFEAAATTDRGRVRVIYERPSIDIVVVITAYPEPN